MDTLLIGKVILQEYKLIHNETFRDQEGPYTVYHKYYKYIRFTYLL